MCTHADNNVVSGTTATRARFAASWERWREREEERIARVQKKTRKGNWEWTNGMYEYVRVRARRISNITVDV